MQQVTDPFEKALCLLDYREHSRAELVKKLVRTFTREEAEKAADRVCELGLVDDERYASLLAAELFNRKLYGKRRVKEALASRGIDRDIVERVIDETEYDSTGNIRKIIEKKYSPLPSDRKERSKVINALMRYGYAYPEIREVFSEIDEFESE